MKFGFIAKHRGIWPAEWLQLKRKDVTLVPERMRRPVKPVPLTKAEMYEMLAEAVRNCETFQSISRHFVTSRCHLLRFVAD
jgi:hypothetical protein